MTKSENPETTRHMVETSDGAHLDESELPLKIDVTQAVHLAERMLAQRERVKEAAGLEKEIRAELCEEMTLTNTEKLTARMPDGAIVEVLHGFRESIRVRKPGSGKE